MKVLYIGGGYVGACSAAVAVDSGHDTLVYDIDANRMSMLGSNDYQQIESCLFENGLAEMLVRNRERIKFVSDYKKVIKFLDKIELVFLCLPTPEKVGHDGESDLSYYLSAVKDIGKSLAGRQNGKQGNYVVVVNKSTVPVNMVDITEEILKKCGVKNFGVVSNPEFLVEGKAMAGSVQPYRVVIGAGNEKDFAVMRAFYQRFYDSSLVKYLEVNPKEAAGAKLLANYLIFARLATTFDVVGRLCELFPDIKFENVRSVLTSDPRIGDWGFYDSFYAGGSCLTKDAASLAYQLEEAGAQANLVKQVSASNHYQRDHFLDRASTELKWNWKNKVVAILGVAFKKSTNDVRNSGALDIMTRLIDWGVKELRIYDPAATPMLKRVFDQTKDGRYEKITYFGSESEALIGSHAGLILTDWPQFKTLVDTIKDTCQMRPYLLMDGRRMLARQFDDLKNFGFDIIAVGSPLIRGNNNK